MTTCAPRLDEFAPDVVVIWGDDQYELFREDVVPAFCVVAADSLTFSPWRGSGGAAIPNVWGEDADTQFELRGHAEFGRHLAASLLHDDFDVAYVYATRVKTGRSRTRSRTRCCSSTTTAWAFPTRSCR